MRKWCSGPRWWLVRAVRPGGGVRQAGPAQRSRGRRQPRGPALGLGFDLRSHRVLDQRRSRAPWPARARCSGSPRPEAPAAAGGGEGGSEGAGALCAEQAGGGRGPGRHVHGGPLLCGERVSVAEGSTGGGGGGGGGDAVCPHLPALLAGGGGETS